MARPGHRGDVLRRLGDLGVIEDRAERRHPQFGGPLGAHQEADIAPVVDPRGVPGGDAPRLARDRALVAEDRRQLGEPFRGRFRPRPFILAEDEGLLSLPDLDGEDLVVQAARLHRRRRRPAANGEPIRPGRRG